MTLINKEPPILEVYLSNEKGVPLEEEKPIEITNTMLNAAVNFAVVSQNDWINLSMEEVVKLWLTHVIEQAVENAKQKNCNPLYITSDNPNANDFL